MTRHLLISAFAILWSTVFHYETLRLHYLSVLACPGYSLAQKLNALTEPRHFPTMRSRCPALPKLKFLYPPAGWIMFFNVDRAYGFAEVYGIKAGQPFLLDPHTIFHTRFVWYDNIRRNILIGVLSREAAPQFCRYLRRKFPEYGAFAVVYGVYPDLVARPDDILRQIMYRCP